jgi:hypothetical protein
MVAFLNLITLFFLQDATWVYASFVLYITLAEFLLLLSSVTLEDFSKDENTGGTRGRYISVQSMGYLFAPLASSIFIKVFGVNSIFILSSIFVLISLHVFTIYLNKVPKIPVSEKNMFRTLRSIFSNIDLRNIIFAQVGLHIFFALLVIFIPFKMEAVGIPLTQYLGVLLPIALFPFLIVPRMLGYIEDKMKNEKEFLMFAIFGLISSLVLIAYTDSSSLFVWAALLFMARVFASVMETSISSYFFKKVNRSDTNLISIFTSSPNLVYLFLVPIYSVIVRLTDLKTLFLTVSFLLCFVLVLVSKIHNTKNYEKHKEWREIWKRAKKRA